MGKEKEALIFASAGLLVGYGLSESLNYLSGDSTWMKPEKLEELMKPGDEIEFKRKGYRHWALASDTQGYVFNISAEHKGQVQALITEEKLTDVANLDPRYNLVRINNKSEQNFMRNFLRKLNPLKLEVTLKEAKSLVGSYVPYNFKGENCEYYVTQWKYGKGFTDQVRDAILNGIAAIAQIFGGFVAAVIGLMESGFISIGMGMYFILRLGVPGIQAVYSN